MSNTRLRSRDPHLARERDRYGHALPSREFILDVLEQQGAPVTPSRLNDLLDIEPEEEALFQRRLSAMERDGQLLFNRKGDICIAGKLDLVAGRVQGHPDGFGFLITDNEGPDIALGPREMQKVLHGDRAMVRRTGVDRRGRPEGRIVEVLERRNQHLVGRFHDEHGALFVVPEDRRIAQDILIPPRDAGNAVPGQIVTVEIIGQPSFHTQPIGRVTEVLGNYGDPGMEIEIALRKHALPFVFSAAAERRANGFAPEVTATDHAGRVDLTHLPLVTIDGETARDFDDAVYCEARGKGFRLIVAIADVSHYVRDGDALDGEARERGNSVYFPRRVIPMLPEALSNGLCSLNPGVDRLCVACDMDIDHRGHIVGYRFCPALMHSHARLTYTEVAAILADPASAAPSRATLVPHLENLQRLFRVLVGARVRRGAIDFETIETQIVFDDHGKIERIVPVQRNDAHRLIEECMLAANVSASDFLQRHEHPTLYRIHEGPPPEKLDQLQEFLKEFGLYLTGGEEPAAKDYAKLLARIKDRPDAQLLQTVMLRSLSQAVYSPENVGHFGLAYEAYTHFTSPIRRYPDLLVHRSIKAVLEGRTYAPGSWSELGRHCSETERRADDASRDVINWLKCYFMRDRLGETFPGTVSAVTEFGIFVALDEIHAEGLVHISELGADYFHFDPPRHQLLGERTGQRFRLGDRLRVRVVRVDMERARIDFVPADAEEAQTHPRARRSAERRGR
ncbi:MAG: ribonuclease R [Burkholderiales bacterium]